MALDRERLFVALFARLSALAGFNYRTRVFESWDDTEPAACPALMLRKGPETARVIQGMPVMWTLSAPIVLYAKNTGGRDDIPSTQLNNLIYAIEGALERKPLDGPASLPRAFVANPGEIGTTLGGLCYGCQITGSIEVYEGLIGGAAMAIIPVDILATA